LAWETTTTTTTTYVLTYLLAHSLTHSLTRFHACLLQLSCHSVSVDLTLGMYADKRGTGTSGGILCKGNKLRNPIKCGDLLSS
jgi:hypothetical protein